MQYNRIVLVFAICICGIGRLCAQPNAERKFEEPVPWHESGGLVLITSDNAPKKTRTELIDLAQSMGHDGLQLLFHSKLDRNLLVHTEPPLSKDKNPWKPEQAILVYQDPGKR